MKKLRISDEYSETLGARHISDGDYSGEDFRENFLKMHFEKALESHEKILIDLDGGYGNPVSFVEEAFGGLAREYGTEKVLNTLVFVCNDEPGLVNEILSYIKKPFDNQVYLDALSRNKGDMIDTRKN